MGNFPNGEFYVENPKDITSLEQTVEIILGTYTGLQFISGNTNSNTLVFSPFIYQENTLNQLAGMPPQLNGFTILIRLNLSPFDIGKLV